MFKNNVDCKLFEYRSDEIRFRKYYVGSNEEVGNRPVYNSPGIVLAWIGGNAYRILERKPFKPAAEK